MDPTAVVIIDPTIGWLGQSWGFWVQTGALLVSVLAAVAVMYHNGRIARIRATIDAVNHQKTDQHLNEALSLILKYYRENRSLSPFIADMNSDEGKAIRLVLNNHEFICLGIRCGAFDKKMFQRMQHYNYLRTWEACCGIVHEIRRQEKRETIFQEFELLIDDWKRKPLRRLRK